MIHGAYPHHVKAGAKAKKIKELAKNRSKNKRQTSKKIFVFAFAFTQFIYCLRAYSHRTKANAKAKIFFDV